MNHLDSGVGAGRGEREGLVGARSRLHHPHLHVILNIQKIEEKECRIHWNGQIIELLNDMTLQTNSISKSVLKLKARRPCVERPCLRASAPPPPAPARHLIIEFVRIAKPSINLNCQINSFELSDHEYRIHLNCRIMIIEFM